MKHLKTISGLCMAILLFASCEKAETKAEKAERELREFVASVEQKADENAEELAEEWDKFQEEFSTRSQEVNEEALEEITKTWNNIQENINKITETEASSPLLALYAAVGLESQNAPMGFIDKDNLVQKYAGFVNHIDQNKSDYSTEDWNDIEEVWSALNQRKEELEPLPADSSAKILAIKAQYTATKAVNKTESAIEEAIEK